MKSNGMTAGEGSAASWQAKHETARRELREMEESFAEYQDSSKQFEAELERVRRTFSIIRRHLFLAAVRHRHSAGVEQGLTEPLAPAVAGSESGAGAGQRERASRRPAPGPCGRAAGTMTPCSIVT
jgi:hypothetical protein